MEESTMAWKLMLKLSFDWHSEGAYKRLACQNLYIDLPVFAQTVLSSLLVKGHYDWRPFIRIKKVVLQKRVFAFIFTD